MATREGDGRSSKVQDRSKGSLLPARGTAKGHAVGYADAIREARTSCGYTQQQAATRAGITVQHWGQVERGKEAGSDQTVALMAQAVGVTPEQLESEGNDSAADRLRDLLDAEPQELTGNERLDDALMLQAILRKLSPDELRWLVAHADMFERLQAHPDDDNATDPHRDHAMRRTG